MTTTKPDYRRGEMVIHLGNSSTPMTDGPIDYAPELEISHIMAGYTDPWHTQRQKLHQQSHQTNTTSPPFSSTSSTITSRKAIRPSSLSTPHGPSARPTSTYRSLLRFLTSFLPTFRSKRVHHRNLQHATLLAQTYFSSCPLSPRLTNERDVYCFCRHLLQGDPLSSGAVAHYIGVLEYRLRDLAKATEYKRLLGLDIIIPDCHGWDYGRWENEVLSSYSAFPSTASAATTTRSSRETTSSSSLSGATTIITPCTLDQSHNHHQKLHLKFHCCLKLISQSHIFASPTEREGHMDLKPMYYLAAAFVSSSQSNRTIKEMLSTVMETKSGLKGISIKLVGKEVFDEVRKKGEVQEKWEGICLG